MHAHTHTHTHTHTYTHTHTHTHIHTHTPSSFKGKGTACCRMSPTVTDTAHRSTVPCGPFFVTGHDWSQDQRQGWVVQWPFQRVTRLSSRQSAWLPTLNCRSLPHQILINHSFFPFAQQGEVRKRVLFLFFCLEFEKTKWYSYSSTSMLLTGTFSSLFMIPHTFWLQRRPIFLRTVNGHHRTVCLNFKNTCSPTLWTPLAEWTVVTDSVAAWEGV